MRPHISLPAFAMAAALFSATEASACRCADMTDEESRAKAALIVKGRMKSITYGIDIPTGNGDGEMSRIARGEFEIEQLLKGNFDGKTIQIYTGTGMGDCGRLGEFMQAALLYDEKELGVMELGLSKTDYEGKTYYGSLICDYSRGLEHLQQ